MTLKEVLDDTIVTWRRERPDLELEPMFTVLRMLQLFNAATRSYDELLSEFGVSTGEFDVLATLRRNGRGAQVSPTVLAKVAMVSPGGMTNRLDRLEAAGFIRRQPDPADRRGSRVSLTPAGRALADRCLDAVVAANAALLAPISTTDRRRIDRVLEQLIAQLDT